MIVDLARQLDKTQRLLQQLLAAKIGTRSEQLSADQLRLFAQELGLKPAAESEQESKRQKPSPWTLQLAAGINASGQIAGQGLINGEVHAFLATPCHRHEGRGECCENDNH